MGDKTNYGEDRIQNALFGDETLPQPPNWYVALFTSVADKEAGIVTEVASGIGYAPVAVPRGSVSWNMPVGGNATVSPVNPVQFGTPTGDWGAGGQITHWGIKDATNGNIWYLSALTNAKSVNSGDAAPSFAAGALTIQDDD